MVTKKSVAKKTVEEIVKKAMPGWRVVSQEPQDSQTTANADAKSVDMVQLRKKYLGEEAARSDQALGRAQTQAKIVVVEPKNADAYRRRSGRKAVVVVDDKVIGTQGKN